MERQIASLHIMPLGCTLREAFFQVKLGNCLCMKNHLRARKVIFSAGQNKARINQE